MNDTPVETERYLVNFGHDENSPCKRLTTKVLEFGVGESVARVDIRALGDPQLDNCQWCDKPLVRVASFELAHKPSV